MWQLVLAILTSGSEPVASVKLTCISNGSVRMRPAEIMASKSARSFSGAITTTRHRGSNSKPSTSSPATTSVAHVPSSWIIVCPLVGCTKAQSGRSSLTSKLTCERDWLVSKLLRPSSTMKGQLFSVKCTAWMNGSSKNL